VAFDQSERPQKIDVVDTNIKAPSPSLFFHMSTARQANSHAPDETAMALSAPDAALALRRLMTRGQNMSRDTNKRPRVASEGEPQRKKAEATGTPASAPDQSNALLCGTQRCPAQPAIQLGSQLKREEANSPVNLLAWCL
jgi:hypothetical protein